MSVEIDLLLPVMEVITSSSDPERPVTGGVTIESIERGVTVRGDVDFGWAGECRRCLEPIGGVLNTQIDEIFQIDAPADSDLLLLVDDQVDLLPLVRDAVLTALPLAPLCADDCAGPDPERYPALLATEVDPADTASAAGAVAGTDEGDERPVDPRWAALDDLVGGAEA